jgi:hypothetical protein
VKKIIPAFLLLIPLFSLTQPGSVCRETIHQSMERYNEHDYTSALSLFQKTIKNKCVLSEIDYYNGACIASLAGQGKLAFAYLRTAVEKGWEQMDHMNKDEDLAPIRPQREYKDIIVMMNARYSKIGALLSDLEYNNFEDAVPFVVNGKWGWLNRKTGIPFTKPLFDYTEFKTARGLFFSYQSKKYLWNNAMTVRPYEDVRNKAWAQDDYALIGLMEPEKRGDSLINGFRTNGKSVTSFSSRFKHVYLLDAPDLEVTIAVARDPQDREAIITPDGSIYKNFDFLFSDISAFLGPGNKTYFIVQEANGGKCLIYDRNAKQVPSQPITKYGFLYSTQLTPLGDYISTYNDLSGRYPGYLKLSNAGKTNVFDQRSLQTIFNKPYDDVILLSGPSTNVNRSSNIYGEGVYEPFFLVTEGKTMFYVDKNGKEYKIK